MHKSLGSRRYGTHGRVMDQGTLLKRFGYTIDVVWSSAFVCPLIIVYWSGTWRLLDLMYSSVDPYVGAYYCIIIGVITNVSGFYALPMLAKFAGTLDSARHVVISRSFLYVYAFCVIVYWRGVWNAAELLIGQNVNHLLCVFAASEGVLMLLRSCVSAIGSPFAVELDSESHFYYTFPRFRTQMNNEWFYLVDACFTVLVIQTCGILIWACLWSFGDIFIFPSSPLLSYAMCMIIGYVLTGFVFAMQGRVHRLAKMAFRWHRPLELAIEDAYKFMATVATLCIWRGLWGIIKDFVFTDETGFALAFTYHIIGFLIMIVLRVGRTLASVGCAVDAEVGHATGTIWPISYFRTALLTHVTTTQPRLRISLEENVDGSSEDECCYEL